MTTEVWTEIVCLRKQLEVERAERLKLEGLLLGFFKVTVGLRTGMPRDLIMTADLMAKLLAPREVQS